MQDITTEIMWNMRSHLQIFLKNEHKVHIISVMNGIIIFHITKTVTYIVANTKLITCDCQVYQIYVIVEATMQEISLLSS